MKREPILDLHGFRVDEVADAIDRFLMSSTKKGLKRIKVMTGKGTGQVKKAAMSYLRLGGYPFEFEKLENGAKNEGVLVVFLDD